MGQRIFFLSPHPSLQPHLQYLSQVQLVLVWPSKFTPNPKTRHRISSLFSSFRKLLFRDHNFTILDLNLLYKDRHPTSYLTSSYNPRPSMILLVTFFTVIEPDLTIVTPTSFLLAKLRHFDYLETLPESIPLSLSRYSSYSFYTKNDRETIYHHRKGLCPFSLSPNPNHPFLGLQNLYDCIIIWPHNYMFVSTVNPSTLRSRPLSLLQTLTGLSLLPSSLPRPKLTWRRRGQ